VTEPSKNITTPITADQVSKLPYIVAVVGETFRLSPSVPGFGVTSFEDEGIGTKGGKKYFIKKASSGAYR